MDFIVLLFKPTRLLLCLGINSMYIVNKSNTISIDEKGFIHVFSIRMDSSSNWQNMLHTVKLI